MDCWSVLDAFNWTGQKSDWINRKILEDWVELVFLPHVNDKREKLDHWSEAALLWMDGHSSRESIKAIDMLAENNVIVSIIPSHTSHVMQPLDRGVNRAFKTNLKRHYKSVLADLDESDKSNRLAIMSATEWALNDALFKVIIKKAFKTSGIFPWNPALILNNPALAPLPTADQLDTTGQLKKRSSRSAVGISSQILTSPNVREEVLASVKAKIAKREKKM